MSWCVAAQPGGGGPRASNGDASPAFARCARIRSITARSVIHAITFISPPHFGQTSGSTSKTFFNTRAQAERRFASGEPGSAGVTGSGAAAATGVPASAPVAPFFARTIAHRRWL